ncbi:MAG: PadR family transcriptional regulator [Capsulimonas sp.]|uniref:PadR family transcriptional regulator n=1 Tax=Capsulimonas sp. TaxID=2494211 RepID=UPI003266E929
MRRDLAKGDLPALVLAVLSKQPMHGYGIVREVERLSDDALTMREGTLYPALRVLEQDGLIVGVWEPQAKGADRKVYSLTDAGIKEAKRRAQEITNYVSLIQTVLGRIDHAPQT